MSTEIHRVFGQTRLEPSEVKELIALSRNIIEDGVVTPDEASVLRTWLDKHDGVTDNPVVCNLLRRVGNLLTEGPGDTDESMDLFDTLANFTAADLQIEEMLKSSNLPFDDPEPEISFADSHFCFTGTFAYGPRAKCERAVAQLGANCGPLKPETNYLVIGVYASDNWPARSYGRNIQRAVTMRSEGSRIRIVGEPQWLRSLPR